MLELLLAAMLALQAPGLSLHSLSEVAEDEGRACLDASPLCAEPQWDAGRRAWVRPETPGEGLARYRTIAEAVATIVAEVDAGAAGAPAWPAGRGAELGRYLVTVAYHESGFREDVHSGIGRHARGDAGRSWCLVQRLLGASGRERTSRGWRARELVGCDAAATRRCLLTGADVLASARLRCGAERGTAYCVLAAYGGVWWSRDPRIRARAATLGKLEARHD